MSLIKKANDSVDLVKSALDAKIALANAEEKERLADAKLALADLKELIADQKDEIHLLKEQIKKKADYTLNKSVYWQSSDKDMEQPFCPACYSKEKIVPLKKTWEGRPKEQSIWDCPEKNCGAVYNPWDYKEPDRTWSVM